MTTSRWINLAIVVAFLICPLAWYVAATNVPGHPIRQDDVAGWTSTPQDAKFGYELFLFASQPPPIGLILTNPMRYEAWERVWIESRKINGW